MTTIVPVFFSKRIEATQEWQQVCTELLPGKALKGSYWLNLRMRGENTTLRVDGLWLGEYPESAGPGWVPSPHTAGVVLEPEAPWGLVNGAETLRVNARVVGATQPGGALKLWAANTCGQSAELTAIPLDEAGVWEGVFAVTGPVAEPYGMVRVQGAVVNSQGGEISQRNETLLARAPDPVPGPLPESPFGVHVQMRDPDLSVVAKLGYKWCRIHDASGITKWAYVEPEPGKWTWFDEQVATARSHGLSILGLLDGAPAWESGDTDSGYWSIYHAPAKIEDWRTYVRQVVGHYAGAIDQWEVWNEPWNMYGFFQDGSIQQYTALMRAAYEEAKATNPNATMVGIDTYPDFWEKGVLACGGYPYYDVASWHRYDSNLAGRINDPIAQVNARINAEQAKYGPPKPLICSEGGIDVTMFHGSFFSFANPALMGDWQRGADAYPRMFLSIIASGSKRFIAYSMHSLPRYGVSTHNMVEPNWLLRPLHLALAGLAHFVEGTRFEKRLSPVPDATALLFSQALPRDFSDGPSTVAVLFSDGEESEPLAQPLPEGLKGFDRFGNAAPTPSEATRAPPFTSWPRGKRRTNSPRRWTGARRRASRRRVWRDCSRTRSRRCVPAAPRCGPCSAVRRRWRPWRRRRAPSWRTARTSPGIRPVSPCPRTRASLTAISGPAAISPWAPWTSKRARGCGAPRSEPPRTVPAGRGVIPALPSCRKRPRMRRSAQPCLRSSGVGRIAFWKGTRASFMTRYTKARVPWRRPP